jgi:hypothetical protein
MPEKCRKISLYAGQEFHLMPELSSQVIDSTNRPISLYDGTHKACGFGHKVKFVGHKVKFVGHKMRILSVIK